MFVRQVQGSRGTDPGNIMNIDSSTAMVLIAICCDDSHAI